VNIQQKPVKQLRLDDAECFSCLNGALSSH